MSDHPENPMLVMLRRIDERTDRIEQRVNSMDRRLGQLELRVAELARDVVSDRLEMSDRREGH